MNTLKFAKESSHPVAQLIRFSIVGGLTFIIYIVIVLLGVEKFHTTKVTAGAIAYAIAIPLNYCMHYFWTFNCKNPHINSTSKYIALTVFGFFINIIGITLFERLTSVHYLASQFIILSAIIILNFCIGRLWVFK